MDELHRLLLVERACTRLNLDYCHAIDSGHASQIADLFTRDGVWDRGDVVLEGRNAIRAFFLAESG